MTIYQALRIVEERGYDIFCEHITLVRLRKENRFLPKYGMDGTDRDKAEWALIDTAEKIDTGIYGAVYYLGGD